MLSLATLLLFAQPDFGPQLAAFAADNPGRARPIIIYDQNLRPEEFEVSGDRPYRIKASSAVGAAWGLQASLDDPKRGIRDRPAHEFRAVMLDVARRYHSISTLRQLVRVCSTARVSYLQLHLTDDQNWMLPTKILRGIDKLNSHGRPAYTVEELVSIQKFASARGVTIIPEVEVPGHANLLVKFRPETLGFQGKSDGNCINIGSEKARSLVKTLLKEVADLFPDSPYLHLGGDEAAYGSAETDPSSVEMMKRKGLKSIQELFVDFVADTAHFVNTLEKKPIVWEGFPRTSTVRQQMPQNLTVVAWEGHYYPADLLSQDGFRVVNAGWNPFYVVNHYPYDSFTALPLPYLSEVNLNLFSHVDGQASKRMENPAGAMLCWWEGHEWFSLSHLPRRILAFGQALWPRSSKPRLEASKAPKVLADGRDIAQTHYFESATTLRAGNSVALKRYSSPDEPTATLTVDKSEIIEVHSKGEIAFRRLIRANRLEGAKIKKVTTNVKRDPDFAPELVGDGVVDDVAAFWLAYPLPAVLQLELANMEEVSEIRVYPFYAAGAKTGYKLESSVDGNVWEAVPPSSDRAVTRDGYRHIFQPRSMRFVRLTVESSDQFPPTMGRIHEVQILPVKVGETVVGRRRS